MRSHLAVITFLKAMNTITTVKTLSMFASSTCAVMGGLLLSAQASYAGSIIPSNPQFEVDRLRNNDFTVSVLEYS